MLEQIANDINILGKFLGKRDIAELTQAELEESYGFKQADVMVLFGGSIICGGDILAQAIKHNVAKKYIIVGGAGHTTQSLRDRVHNEFPSIETDNLPEAEIFNKYIEYQYGLTADYLECESTNCGNNITFLLELLRLKGIKYKSIIISQDATMQYRMEAGLKKYDESITIINFAVYSAEVVAKDVGLRFKEDIYGMWDMERYISLLLGEIPRLTDDNNGYGPNGKNYISHVDIPKYVEKAFSELSSEYSNLIREANPEYASK